MQWLDYIVISIFVDWDIQYIAPHFTVFLQC